jgi:DnaJ-class molecular chaperone
VSNRDYYETLNVERNASPHKIKEAYRKLAFQYHPDRNRGNALALEKMKEINEAYAILSDQGKRREYDTLSHEYGPAAYDRFRQAHSDQDIFRGSDINQIFQEMTRAFGFRGFEEVFRESYGQGYQSFEFRRPSVFGRVIFYGPGFRRTQRRVSPSEGSSLPGLSTGILGKLIGYVLKRVWKIEPVRKGGDWYEAITLTPWQAMQGGKIRYVHRKKGRELMVTIPSGIGNGQKLRLRGMGEKGKGGGEPGDLYLKVLVRRPIFQRIKELLLRG